MKHVIISADGERMLYAVPDPVAENLREYCLEFCDHWLPESPDAAPYRRNGGLCYTEADFIEYLNQYQFPDEPSVLIKNLPDCRRNMRRFRGSISDCAPFPENQEIFVFP